MANKEKPEDRISEKYSGFIARPGDEGLATLVLYQNGEAFVNGEPVTDDHKELAKQYSSKVYDSLADYANGKSKALKDVWLDMPVRHRNDT